MMRLPAPRTFSSWEALCPTKALCVNFRGDTGQWHAVSDLDFAFAVWKIDYITIDLHFVLLDQLFSSILLLNSF